MKITIKKIKQKWLFFLVFIVIAAVIGYFFLLPKKDNKRERYKIRKVDLIETLDLAGEIDSEEKVTLRFQTSGRLAWVGVKEGDYVKRGQIIASLDKRELQNRMQKFLNSYVNQRLTFEQTKDDNWQKQFDFSESVRIRAERLLKQNQLNLDNAVLEVEAQNLALEFANLISPIEGVVTKLMTPYAGVNLTPAQAEFEIINPKTLFFSAKADQTEVVKLMKGKKGKIIFDSFPEEEFKGEIYWISFKPLAGEATTVYQIKVKFDPRNKEFKLGMSGDISFVIKERLNVLAVPTSYLKRDSEGDYVRVFKENQLEKRRVKLGEEIDGRVEVISGLKEGEEIVN